MSDVAVITTTIGRQTLRETIESVRAQTRVCKHYVFVHGAEYRDASAPILADYPDVVAVYLPVNNSRADAGHGGYGPAFVYAAAPYLIAEDIVCYLDDDNTYHPRHVDTCALLIEENNLQFAFSLRNIIAESGELICPDNCESLGYFPNITGRFIADQSCLAVRAPLARRCAFGWQKRIVSDRSFLRTMMDLDVRCGCTAKHTVNYRLSTDSPISITAQQFQEWNIAMALRHKGGFPWAAPNMSALHDA